MLDINVINRIETRIKVLEAENKGLEHKIKYLEKQLEDWKRIGYEGY